MPTVRVMRHARARALRLLAAADAAGLLKGYAIHAPEDGETRFSFVLADERRELELPGVAAEPDEDW